MPFYALFALSRCLNHGCKHVEVKILENVEIIKKTLQV